MYCIAMVALVKQWRTKCRCDCGMSPSPMICAEVLTLLYYYNATALVFTHNDPVPCGRSVLG